VQGALHSFIVRIAHASDTHQVHSEWRVCACLQVTCKCQCLKQPCTCRRSILVTLAGMRDTSGAHTSSIVAQIVPRGRGAVQHDTYTRLCLVQPQTLPLPDCGLCLPESWMLLPVWSRKCSDFTMCTCERVACRRARCHFSRNELNAMPTGSMCVSVMHACSSQSHGLCGACTVDMFRMASFISSAQSHGLCGACAMGAGIWLRPQHTFKADERPAQLPSKEPFFRDCAALHTCTCSRGVQRTRQIKSWADT
jgi:hypothetical protein